MPANLPTKLQVLILLLCGIYPRIAPGAESPAAAPALEPTPPQTGGQDGPTGAGREAPLYEEDIVASDPVRSEQAHELETYLAGLREAPSVLHAIFTPDFSSLQAYERSTRELRQALCVTLGYPAPGRPDPETPTFEKVGRDA